MEAAAHEEVRQAVGVHLIVRHAVPHHDHSPGQAIFLSQPAQDRALASLLGQRSFFDAGDAAVAVDDGFVGEAVFAGNAEALRDGADDFGEAAADDEQLLPSLSEEVQDVVHSRDQKIFDLPRHLGEVLRLQPRQAQARGKRGTEVQFPVHCAQSDLVDFPPVLLAAQVLFDQRIQGFDGDQGRIEVKDEGIAFLHVRKRLFLFPQPIFSHGVMG